MRLGMAWTLQGIHYLHDEAEMIEDIAKRILPSRFLLGNATYKFLESRSSQGTYVFAHFVCVCTSSLI